jgi:hypothetical protein
VAGAAAAAATGGADLDLFGGKAEITVTVHSMIDPAAAT